MANRPLDVDTLVDAKTLSSYEIVCGSEKTWVWWRLKTAANP
ncbi:MAG: hypothetical protein AAF394_07345 [Planctomycetota bacterium]